MTLWVSSNNYSGFNVFVKFERYYPHYRSNLKLPKIIMSLSNVFMVSGLQYEQSMFMLNGTNSFKKADHIFIS